MLKAIRDRLFKAESPGTKETAWVNDSYLWSLQGGVSNYNPDELIQRKGADIYKKMLKDPQVKAAYNLLINIIVSRNYRFSEQNEISDFFHYNIEQLKGSWISALRAITLAKAHGYSVSEKVFKAGKYEGKDKWLIATIKAKPFESFAFKVDKFGNIIDILQDQDGEEQKLNPENFILMVNQPETDPIWGVSDLAAVYRPYWEKDVILKLRNIWLERLAGGFITATQGENAAVLQGADKANFKETLSNITKATSIMLPMGWSAQVVEGTDTEAFERALTHCDKQIAKALLLPDLLGLSEDSKFGSRSLGSVQLEVLMMLLKEQGDYLADVLNEQLFKQLAGWNYSETEIPKFEFEPYTTAQKQEIVKVWGEALKTGSVTNTFEDELKTRSLLEYPEIEEPEEPPEEPEEPPEEPEELPEEPSEEEPFKEFSEGIIERVDFKAIEFGLDKTEAGFVKALGDSVDEAMDDIKEQYKTSYENLPDDKNAIQFDQLTEVIQTAIRPETKSEMAKAIRDNLRETYLQGREDAKKIIRKASEGASETTKERIESALIMAQRTATKKSDWSVLNFIEGVALSTAESYFQSEAFKITGDITEEMLKNARRVFIDGVRDERSIDDIINSLNETLPTLVGVKDPETGKPDKQERARLETIARTNMTSTYVQAQLAMYADPDLGDFVQGLEYSAVMDSRVSDICENLNGRKYKKNDSIWGNISPPNHFNCRSILIPVTEMDEWTESDKEGFKKKRPGEKGNYPAPGFGQAGLTRKVDKEKEEPVKIEGNIEAGEKSIKDNSYETAIAYDPETGEEVFRKKGEKSSVYFTAEEIEQFKGKIFTHNHPGDSGFSIEDVVNGYKWGIKEMRAVGKVNKQSVIYDYDKIPDLAAFRRGYKKQERRVYEEYEKAISDSIITIEDADKAHHRQVMRYFTGERPDWFEYEEKKW